MTMTRRREGQTSEENKMECNEDKCRAPDGAYISVGLPMLYPRIVDCRVQQKAIICVELLPYLLVIRHTNHNIWVSVLQAFGLCTAPPHRFLLSFCIYPWIDHRHHFRSTATIHALGHHLRGSPSLTPYTLPPSMKQQER